VLASDYFSLFLVDFKMTVVEAYFGGNKMDSPDNAQSLSANVTSLIVEVIAQNTSGSIFEPEVSTISMKKANTYIVCIPCYHHILFEISFRIRLYSNTSLCCYVPSMAN
jgi:hypothetical protein